MNEEYLEAARTKYDKTFFEKQDKIFIQCFIFYLFAMYKTMNFLSFHLIFSEIIIKYNLYKLYNHFYVKYGG